MKSTNRKEHWENIYENKQIDEVSWYQETPSTSLDFIKEINLPKSAKIIDIGGGNSFLVDHLLAMGYRDITVLDISEQALENVKTRLGKKGQQVKWITADVVEFQPAERYDLWHDRAAFHFLTNEEDIEHYLSTIKNCIKPAGFLIMGTFSEEGPEKCSGVTIKQYSEQTLTNLLKDSFKKIRCVKVDHETPFDTIQNFLFCSFKSFRKDTRQ